MLESITIRNFQRHKSLTIKLDPMITTIVGPSDVGKSAVVRALRWLALNRPTGVKFLRHGAKQATVRLKIDGHVVKRTKSKGGNTYGIDGRRLRSFKSGVPEHVTKLLNLNDSNFQSQWDSAYWFGESKAEVSRQLNSIINLGLIDKVLGELHRRSRKLAIEREVVRSARREARATARSLRWTVRAERMADRIRALAGRVSRAQQRAVELHSLIRGVRGHTQTRSRAGEGTAGANRVLELGLQWAQTDKRAGVLADVLEKVSAAQVQRKRKVPRTARGLDKLAEAFRKTRLRSQTIDTILRGVEEAKQNQRRARDSAERLERQLVKLIGKRCPICQRKM